MILQEIHFLLYFTVSLFICSRWRWLFLCPEDVGREPSSHRVLTYWPHLDGLGCQKSLIFSYAIFVCIPPFRFLFCSRWRFYRETIFLCCLPFHFSFVFTANVHRRHSTISMCFAYNVPDLRGSIEGKVTKDSAFPRLSCASWRSPLLGFFRSAFCPAWQSPGNPLGTPFLFGVIEPRITTRLFIRSLTS